MRCFLACVLFCVLAAGVAEAGGSFIYVPVLPCTAGPTCAPEVQVYDAATSGLVTQIPLRSGATINSTTISRDGRRVCIVENLASGGRLLAVIDTSANTLTAEYALSPDDRLIAAGGDSRQVVMLAGNRIDVLDIETGALVRSTSFALPVAEYVVGFAASATDDRVFVSTEVLGSFGSRLLSIDSITGTVTVMQDSSKTYARGQVFISSDGAHLYDTPYANLIRPSSTAMIQVWDLATNAIVFSTPTFLSPTSGGVESFRTRRAYMWSRSGVVLDDIDTWSAVAGTSPRAPLPKTIGQMVVSADDSRVWIETAPDQFDQTGINALTVTDALLTTIVSTIPMVGTTYGLVATPPGAPTCGYQIGTHQSSWTVNGGTATLSLSTQCPWLASSSAPWARIDHTSGTGDAVFTLTVDQNFTTTNRSATLTIGGQLVTVTQASFSAVPPFGTVDTPSEGLTGVTGALNVSGWALDDVGVTRVRVYRDPVGPETSGQLVYIGDGVFVDGARPDVQAAFPAYPNASRAGWGLQVLTNMLPGGGTGTYRLTVLADDVEGHTTLLGTRTITCTNAMATLPFGTIDTPTQGQTVSGIIINYGWALSQPGRDIAADSSTITVLIDGAAVGHPGPRSARADITATFPALVTDHAVGGFVLDTTTLTNGVHTIAWIVQDNAGNTVGVGSRFLTVANQ
jgi:hypothetical protein